MPLFFLLLAMASAANLNSSVVGSASQNSQPRTGRLQRLRRMSENELGSQQDAVPTPSGLCDAVAIRVAEMSPQQEAAACSTASAHIAEECEGSGRGEDTGMAAS